MFSLTKLNPTAPQTIPTCKVSEAWLYHALAKVASGFSKRIISIWKLIYISFSQRPLFPSRISKKHLRFISAWWVWSDGGWSICQVMALGALWLDGICNVTALVISPPTLFVWHFYKGIHPNQFFGTPLNCIVGPAFFPELFHKVRSWTAC